MAFGLFNISYWYYLLFKKYGYKNWVFALPILNKWKMIELTNKPKWWFILLAIPFIRLIFVFKINLEIAKDFNKSIGYALGLTFLPFIFFVMLGFGNQVKLERLIHEDSIFEEFI